MKKFEGVLIVSDFDGTIACDGRCSAENADAIRRFTEGGGLFTLCTGRNPAFIVETAREIGCNTLLGAYNGAILYDLFEDRIVSLKDIGVKAEEYYNIVLSRFPIHRRTSVGHRSDMTFFTDGPVEKDFFRTIDEPICKIVFHQEPELTLQMMDDLQGRDDFDVYSSADFMVEMMPKGINKGYFVREMRRRLSDRVHTTIAIGDYNNDVPMIRAADVGIAVTDGHPDAIASADLMAPPVERHTMAWLIDQLERDNI